MVLKVFWLEVVALVRVAMYQSQTVPAFLLLVAVYHLQQMKEHESTTVTGGAVSLTADVRGATWTHAPLVATRPRIEGDGLELDHRVC